MDDDTPATFDDGSTTKVIPGEGTYTDSSRWNSYICTKIIPTGTGTGVTVKH